MLILQKFLLGVHLGVGKTCCLFLLLPCPRLWKIDHQILLLRCWCWHHWHRPWDAIVGMQVSPPRIPMENVALTGLESWEKGENSHTIKYIYISTSLNIPNFLWANYINDTEITSQITSLLTQLFTEQMAGIPDPTGPVSVLPEFWSPSPTRNNKNKNNNK